MIKLQLVTSPGCSHCAQAKKILAEIKPDHPELSVEEIDMATEKGQELITKHQIMASPGVIINGKLFQVGGLDKNKLLEKLSEIKTEKK